MPQIDPIQLTIIELDKDIAKLQARRAEQVAMLDARQEADEQLKVDALQKKADQGISTLPATEAQVVRLLYGIDTGRAQSVEEVAGTLGLSVEGVKALETIALSKMRQA